MKNRIVYCLNLVWTSFAAFTFPICFGLIFMCLTGHSKGYDYDLGSEKSVSVLFGFILLLILPAAVLPSEIYVVKRTAAKGRKYTAALLALYIALAAVGIFVCYGGPSVFLKEVFNIG